MSNNLRGKKQKPGKSIFMKLLEWLTVQDAAKHLSIVFGEEFTEAHVLRLALDGQLTLSVNFVNNARACPGGRFLPFQEWEEDFRKGLSLSGLKAGVLKELPGGGTLAFRVPGHSLIFAPQGTTLDIFKKLNSKQQEKVINSAIDKAVKDAQRTSKEYGGKVPPDWFDNRVETISGVWDLPMIGGERLDVEHKYQQMTDGPGVTLIDIDGAFVADPDGKIWQLQERLDLKELREQANTAAAGDSAKDNQENKVQGPYDNHGHGYYLVGGLPEDSVLVVRTSALREFEERIDMSAGGEKPPSMRAEASDLHIIAALLATIMENKLFPSEEKLRASIADMYRGYAGCTERTLADRFASAKRSISASD